MISLKKIREEKQRSLNNTKEKRKWQGIMGVPRPCSLGSDDKEKWEMCSKRRTGTGGLKQVHGRIKTIDL